MGYQRQLCERIERILGGSRTLAGADVLVEDKCDPQSAVNAALARLGVAVLIAVSGHRRKSGVGSSTAGDFSIEVTVFENPRLNRDGNDAALTVSGAAEAVADALHGERITFEDGSTTRLVYVDMTRADADGEDYRMAVRFAAFKSLDPAKSVCWGVDGSVVGEVVRKTMTRGGTPVFEPGRDGNVRFVGTRDRHWKANVTCTVPFGVTENDLPEIGAPFRLSGTDFVTETAEITETGDDASSVSLTGRTV